MKRVVSLAVAAAVAVPALVTAGTADARPGYGYRGRPAYYAGGYRRNRGNYAAGAAIAGVAGALIGGAIAAQSSRRYYDGYAGPGYGYYAPAPAYYAPAPAYGYYGY